MPVGNRFLSNARFRQLEYSHAKDKTLILFCTKPVKLIQMLAKARRQLQKPRTNRQALKFAVYPSEKLLAEHKRNV
jgi:hypothetical protein